MLVLNKIDLALQSKHVHWRANEIWAVGSFKKTFHLSALTGNGVRALKDYLLGEAPPGPWVFPPDMVAALSKVEQVEQLVRTYLLVWFNSRLPYTVQQQTVGSRRLGQTELCTALYFVSTRFRLQAQLQ